MTYPVGSHPSETDPLRFLNVQGKARQGPERVRSSKRVKEVEPNKDPTTQAKRAANEAKAFMDQLCT